MNNEELKKIMRIARDVAIKRGHREIADDFAQEAAIGFITGRNASLDNQLTDFLRAEYGDSRTTSGSLRQHETHVSTSLDAERRDLSGLRLGDSVSGACHVASDARDSAGENWRGHTAFFGRHGAIVDLHFDRDWMLKEIASLYGVSPARISQQLKVIEKEIADAAIVSERLEDYRTDPDASKLNISWIKL